MDEASNSQGEIDFETFSKENGFTFWYASEFADWLGYSTFAGFQKALNKAMGVCITLGIPVIENFVQATRIVADKELADYKLSRFACYLCAVNADVKKPKVAAAQVYFIKLADSFRQILLETEQVDRITIRDEVTEREKSLSGVAKSAGIENYAYFTNAGYRGLYNMNINQLRQRKGIPEKKSPLDYMGREELAANLFRMTQTELKIKNEEIKGQKRLEAAAEQVGKQVRRSMQEISGTRPEDLPSQQAIQDVKKELKQTNRNLKKIDYNKKKDK